VRYGGQCDRPGDDLAFGVTMNCIGCGKKTQVIDSRITAGNRVIRRRQCMACQHRFSTYEQPFETMDIDKRYRQQLKIAVAGFIKKIKAIEI
jgi:hypothetical protein